MRNFYGRPILEVVGDDENGRLDQMTLVCRNPLEMMELVEVAF